MNITSMVISVLLIGAIAFVVKYEPSKASVESRRLSDTAELCWKDYERKSLTPPEKIFIAKTCESLEAQAKTAKAGR